MESEEQAGGKDRTRGMRHSMLGESSVRISESLDLETLLNTSPVGLVVIDAIAGTLVSINQEARRLSNDLLAPGQRMDHLLKTMTVRRGDGKTASSEEHPVARATSTGETIRAEEVVFHVPDGRRVSVLMNAAPVHSDDGGVASLVVTLQDLTPIEDLLRLRGGLLAVVSHELRTPLAATKGAASTALGDSAERDAAETSQLLRIIDEQADFIYAIIKDLQDVAGIGTGALPVDPQPEAVIDLVEQARDAFVGGAGRSNVRIDLPPDLPRVMADGRRIVGVLGNLLFNAAGYTPDATPIRIAAVEDGHHLAITVSDQRRKGSGERVSSMFRKLTGHAEGEAPDDEVVSGWGLAVCRGIVEAHGGRIRVNSEGLELETRITFTLPIAEEVLSKPEPPSGADDALRRTGGREPVSILVVDDDIQALRNVKNVLSGEGYAPVATGNPHDIPDLLEQHRPSLVLLDLVLPGTDGIDVMIDVIANPDLPVIFLSAYAHEEAIARAFDAGAADYVVKPFAPAELSARIRAALRRREEREHALLYEPFVLGDLRIDHDRREVTIAERPVQLTKLEYRLMVELSTNAGRLVTSEDLLRRVWDTPDSGDTRRLRTTIKKIRRKLGDDANNPTYILNQPGEGYRLGDVPDRGVET